MAWSQLKGVSDVIKSAVVLNKPDAYCNLEKALRQHKQYFTNLLKNPPRNSSHKALVEAATKVGLSVSTASHPLVLPQDFIDEALILSNILDLNELTAVELLLAGEQTRPDFPSLTRGLVAVMLYYDSKQTLADCLRMLIQSRQGISWTSTLASNVTELITKFTDDLLQNGLMEELLKQVNELSVEKEMEKLSKGQAVKEGRHKQDVIALIKGIRYILTDCLFYWSCQTPFDKDRMLLLVKELKKVSTTSEGHHPLDQQSLALYFTLVSSFTVGSTSYDQASLENIYSDNLPVFSDLTLIPALQEEIQKDDWSNQSLGAAVLFAWAVFLRECSPYDALREVEELKDDEDLLDNAINNEVFQFLRQSVITSPHFFPEELYVKRLHHIITSFIVLMPNKVTELRNHGDEVAREEIVRGGSGNPTPSTAAKPRQDFGEMMKLVGDLYYEDPNHCGLSLEYWAPVEDTSIPSATSNKTIQASHRQLSLLKFVHQCSELLPPSLFTSFMTLLVGISNSAEAARHSFNFLKSNSPSLGGGGPSASFSLDHFFHSLKQYYYALKQDARVKQTPSGCAISPQEVEALLAVLNLIKTIAKHDENARVVMYENQSWLPVASMFGLIGCAIPLPLKSAIFLTLAEFARSIEITGTMWQTLENSQVLNTVPNISAGSDGHYGLGPSSSREGSIQIELEEIESAAEEYTQTRAFLSLLNAMTNMGVPTSLGIGHRVPGFQPYLEFVLDSVLLKFDTRCYKDPQEKWLLASGAMEVILKLLTHHEVTPLDFEEQAYEVSPGRMVPLPPPPGHTILHYLLNDSVLLRKILFIIDDCANLLNDVDSITDAVSRAGLLALQILECAMRKQEAFFTVLRETSGHSVMATPLDHLLLSINPRTHRADYYVSVARYVTFKYCSSELALTAVKIIRIACQSLAVSKEILNTLIVTQDICVSVIHGFMECLELKDVATPSNQEQHSEGVNEEGGVSEDDNRQLKEEILRLLIVCAKTTVPNIARLLLGFIQPPFERRKLKESPLQDPGVLGSLKTCLHSVLQLVAIGNDPHQPIGCHLTHPKLAEMCYHLLYLLCVNKDLTENTMRYLRNNHSYFHTQLSIVPFPWFHEVQQDSTISSLKQQAWILCTAALEMRMTLLSNQLSHSQQLVNLLLKLTTLTDPQFSDTTLSAGSVSIWTNKSNLDLDSTHYSDSLGNEGRRKLLSILDYISFDSLEAPPLELTIFDQERTESVIASCETRDENNCPFINVQVLRGLLMNELNSVQGAAIVSQKHLILQEIFDILRVSVERNRVQELMQCRQQLMDSWCKVVEIMVGVVNQDQEKEEVKVSVLFEVIQDLLLKVDKIDMNTLTASAHGVIFVLMAQLQRTISNQSKESDKSQQTLAPLASGPLQSIFRCLLDDLVKCPVGMQRLKAHLYSSLLSYLQMTKEKPQTDKTDVWRLESDNGLTSANLSVLSDCGEGLMDVVCRDACSGHDVAKMLSLSLLDSIIDIDKRCYWLQYMTTCGYLQKICSSLLWEDEVLQNMLHPQPASLRPLYIYESKMAFLCRVASTTVGARDLVSLNCLASFNECKYIDCRPPSISGVHTSSLQPSSKFIPSVGIRYLNLLFPVLRLLLAILSTPGPHSKEASTQVLVFIRCHMEVFVSILKDNQPPTLGTLQELHLVTAIVCHCKAGQDWVISNNATPNSNTRELFIIQSHLLSLLPNYLTPLHWKRIAQEVAKTEGTGRGSTVASSGGGSPNFEEAYSLSQQICSNLLTFCQNAVSASGSEFSINFYRIMFTPDLSDATVPQPSQGVPNSSGGGPPSLGLLISSIRAVCDGYFSAIESVEQVKKKLDSIKNMTTEEMKELVPDHVTDRKTMTISQLQTLSSSFLQKTLEAKEQQVSMFIYVANSSAPPTFQGGPKDRFDVSLMSYGITMNDLEQLKSNIGNCLSDTLFKKLLDINNILSQTRDDSTVGFIHALTRRVKKLLKLKAAAKPLLNL